MPPVAEKGKILPSAFSRLPKLTRIVLHPERKYTHSFVVGLFIRPQDKLILSSEFWRLFARSSALGRSSGSWKIVLSLVKLTHLLPSNNM